MSNIDGKMLKMFCRTASGFGVNRVKPINKDGFQFSVFGFFVRGVIYHALNALHQINFLGIVGAAREPPLPALT
ncbi:MAG: hypothetical protein NTY36_16040 [Deltaproteobacteria bacterium]|nr:hypothetical protein [Deltaproteobacteria bacterium]